MKIEVDEFGNLVLKEIYNSVIIKTESEELAICMRDGGFEFRYMNQWYTAIDNKVTRVGPMTIEGE